VSLVAADPEMGAGGQQGAVLRNAAPLEPMVLPPVASSNDLDADPEVWKNVLKAFPSSNSCSK
jgi:hypothetical protein